MSDMDVASTSEPVFRDIGQIETRQVSIPFASPRGLAIAVTAAAALRGALALVQIGGLVTRLKVLSDVGHAGLTGALRSEAQLADTIVEASAGLGFIVVIGCYIAGGMWIYRAARNVRALGARGLETSPGWAVGFYAIPIMNWFRPLLAMSEIWRASHWPDRWRSQTMPPLLGFWWAGWIVAGLASNIVSAMSKLAHDMDMIRATNQVALLATVAELVTMGLFLTIVWRVTRAQQTTRQHVQQVAETFA